MLTMPELITEKSIIIHNLSDDQLLRLLDGLLAAGPDVWTSRHYRATMPSALDEAAARGI